jgi:hypothetical protein
VEIDIGKFVIRNILGISTNYLHLTIIIASSYTRDIAIDKGLSCMLHDSLGSRKHWGIVMKEIEPVVDIPP